MKEIKAPKFFARTKLLVFLAGSIEMGKAENWQEKVTKEFEHLDVFILNPRRDDWDSSWEQKIENDQFREQVEWELAALEHSDVILMYFDPNTKSPITLLELGLFARTKKLIVCCPDGYWKKGNVDVICSMFNIRQVATIEDLVGFGKDYLKYSVFKC